MYAEADDAAVAGATYTLTKQLTPFGGAAVEFRYHMFGGDAGTLQFRTSVDGVAFTTRWSKTGPQQFRATDAWGLAVVPTPQGGAPPEFFRFASVRGAGAAGDVAVDAFKVRTAHRGP
jgi:hypothetical protein